MDALVTFASGRGHVLFLGGPFLDDPVWPTEAGWVNRDAIAAAKTGVVPQHGLWADQPLSTDGWLRTCNDPSTPGSWEVVGDGPQGQPCFRFWTKNLTGWDGYLSPDTPQLFAEQHALLSFQAKGGPATRQIVVEIQEQDGSRWMAVVDVGPQWQRSGLDAHDFQLLARLANSRSAWWGRGPVAVSAGAPHQLPSRILARLGPHTGGTHLLDCRRRHVGASPAGTLCSTVPNSSQTLETIFPRYKVYSLEDPVTLRPTTHPGASAAGEWSKTNGLVCGIPRTMGRGFLKDQKWRYLPVLDGGG